MVRPLVGATQRCGLHTQAVRVMGVADFLGLSFTCLGSHILWKPAQRVGGLPSPFDLSKKRSKAWGPKSTMTS